MHKDTAEVVQQHLMVVGINAQLNLPDWATRVTLGNKGQYALAVMGTAADSNDPDGLSNLIDGTLAPSYVRSHGLQLARPTELLQARRVEFDQDKRKATHKEPETGPKQVVPSAGLSWRWRGHATRTTVPGVTTPPHA